MGSIARSYAAPAVKSTVDQEALTRFITGPAAEAGRATKPFEQVGVVNRCIRLRGDALKSMPLMVSTRDDELVESGDLVDLLNSPYPGLSGEDLIEWIDALVQLTGACYLIIEATLGQLPQRIRPVSARSCRPRYDRGGDLLGYEYRRPGDKSRRWVALETHEVIALTLSNYQSEMIHDGISQLTPAKRSIDQLFGADTANLESLHNGTEPGMVFDYGDGVTPTDEQRDQIYQQVDDNHRGVYRRNRPIVTGGGATVQTFVKSFTDMEFSKLKAMSTVDVCVALGVPPLVAGFSGEAGMGHGKELEEARAAFWDNVLATSSWIARKLTVGLAARYQGRSRTNARYVRPEAHRLRCPTHRRAAADARRRRVRVAGEGQQPLEHYLWFDSSMVDPVRDAALRRLKEAVLLHKELGATQAEVIEAYDAPVPADHDWQKTWYKPMGLVDIQEAADPDDAPPTGNPPAPAPAPAPAPEDEPPADGESTDTDGKSTGGGRQVRALSDAQRAKLHDLWWASIQPLITRSRRLLNGHLRGLRGEMLANLERWSRDKSVQRRDVVATLLFDLTRADDRLRARAKPIVYASVVLGGSQSMQDAAVAEGKPADDAETFNVSDPRVAETLRRRENRITGTNARVYRRVQQRLAEAVEQGTPVAELADLIRDQMKIEGNRAATIARTEIGGAVEEARHAGRRQAGVPLKSWLWSRKETGRENHARCEAQTHDQPVGQDELFVLPVTGNTCLHPRATGDPRDDVNCGCTTLSRYPDDQRDAALLAHHFAHGFLDAHTLDRRLTAGQGAAA